MNSIRKQFGPVVVVALKRITEEGFSRAGEEHVHAEPGDRGEVIEAFSHGTRMIQWFRSGTVAECSCDDVRGAA